MLLIEKIKAIKLRYEANILKNHIAQIKDFESNPNFGCFEILAIKK